MSTYLSAIGQIALPAADADRALAYYRDVVGLAILYRYDQLIFFDCHGVRLMIEGNPKNEGRPRSGCIYFKVPDIDRAYEDLQLRGVTFEGAPHLIARMPDHELWMAFFKDPDGNQLAVMTEKR